jgi:hypothetical protein
MRHEVATRRVLYEIPGMQSVQVRKSEFKGANGDPLPMEIYEPINPIGAAVVAIVAGLPDAAFEKHVGCKFMEMEWTIGMARLIAASGMTAVTHSNREPQPDGIALMQHLGAKYRKAGLWSTSANGPVALVVASHAACAVLNNPMVKDFCPDTPLFVVRAGKDENPGLNEALDAFVARALADDKPLTLVNHAGARHSYELWLDTPETHRILQQGLDFLRAYLR